MAMTLPSQRSVVWLSQPQNNEIKHTLFCVSPARNPIMKEGSVLDVDTAE